MTCIAIVTNSLSGGGAERAMNLLADNLSKFQDLNVLLIPINAGPRDLVEPHCDIHEIGRVWHGGLWNTIKAFAKFQRVILKFKPKFLILNCDLPEFYSALSIWNAKCIIVEHTTRPWAGRKIFGNLIRRILLLRKAKYVRVSERINISTQFNDTQIIPNIIDPNIFGNKIKQNEIPKSLGKLIFIGRLSKEKRPELFIELARITQIESIIIGDGLLSSTLRKESEDVSNLKFLGQQLNPWEFASNRDLLIMTSEYEGDGLVALEAVSLGIPVALLKNSDLQSLRFPQRNYFDDIPTLATHITKRNFEDFELNVFERNHILENRSPETISRLWIQYLLSLKRSS